MIEDGGVQPQGCICEPCSDISTNCRDMRSGFGYTGDKQNSRRLAKWSD